MSKGRITPSLFCYKCGKEAPRKDLVISVVTGKTYHSSCADFNDFTTPVTEGERYKELIQEQYGEAVNHLVGGVVSYRPTPAQVIYLYKAMQMTGIDSINKMLNYLIEEMMKKQPLDLTELIEVEKEIIPRFQVLPKEQIEEDPQTDELKEEEEAKIKEEIDFTI
jgi:hypothetical protein